MLKQLLLSIVIFAVIICSSPTFAKSPKQQEYDPLFALADVVILRPMGLTFTIIGTALFVGLSPVTALASITPPHDAFEQMAYILIKTPVDFTFKRPLGVNQQVALSVMPKDDTESGGVTKMESQSSLPELKDSDSDGVPDDDDICQNTPSGASTDKEGCWAYHGVYFEFDKDEIKPEFKSLFDNAIEVLEQNPGLTVEIQGHTDSAGLEEYNQKLSERRAQAVKNYLMMRGINPARLKVKGYGGSYPVASNDTEEGRAYNRRVSFERTDLTESH